MIDKYSQHRLLIISNNVLSTTRNNGKTLLSLFEGLPEENIAQLYFSSESPKIGGYSYYRLSDTDVIKGRISKKKRGATVEAVANDAIQAQAAHSEKRFGNCLRLFREILWKNAWKSQKLIDWLDDIRPTCVFFVGGDAGFAFDICKFVHDRYTCRVTLFITDDYVLPRMRESAIARFRRKLILKKTKHCLHYADGFVTISNPMRQAYRELFGRESVVAMNMVDSLRTQTSAKKTKQISLMYAGSLYYGRDAVLGLVANAVAKFNKTSENHAKLRIFTNTVPNDATKRKFERDDACEYAGSLNKEELILEMNMADILVFVESFEAAEIEKTRFSLSTKIPEYLSVGKPIFAVGPDTIASMECLADCAMCTHKQEQIQENMAALLHSCNLRESYAEKARSSFDKRFNKTQQQKELLAVVFGR